MLLPMIAGAALASVLLLLFMRTIYVLLVKSSTLPGRRAPARTMVVLGSGGHTAEMLMLLNSMDKQRYFPRCYVVAATDSMSAAKAQAKEQTWQGAAANALVHTIPRSREVGQSYITSVWTTLYALGYSAVLVLRERPELLLVNGPGTCIPLCAAAFAFRCLGILATRIVYVESIARTRRFSLSAKILYKARIADVVFVQWEELVKKYPRAVFKDRLY